MPDPNRPSGEGFEHGLDTLALVEETATISKRQVSAGKVVIRTDVETEDRMLRETLDLECLSRIRQARPCHLASAEALEWQDPGDATRHPEPVGVAMNTSDILAMPDPAPVGPSTGDTPMRPTPTEVPSRDPLGIPQPGPDVIDPGVGMPGMPGSQPELPGAPGMPGSPGGPGII